jgi:hypothetical protein
MKKLLSVLIIFALVFTFYPFDEQNSFSIEIPTKELFGATPNEYIVIAQLNFWYYGPGFWGGFEGENHERNTSLTPLLGETYYASDPSVVYRQIEWAVEYGVDAFSIEWTTPRGVGQDMEVTLDDVFLKSPNINKVRWAIFYDFPLRLDQTPGLNVNVVPNINFDQPDVYNTFVSDFVHFAKKYFGNPQYLTIDDRPVVYIWATNSYVGNLAGAMQEARDQVSELGYDVFIVGDEVCVGCFDPDHASLFDGSSTFTMLIPGLDPAKMRNVGEAAVAVDGAFKWWTNQISGLKVAGREDLVNFQPAWAPQYDDRKANLVHPTYVPAMSKDQVVQMAMVARKYAEPVGSNGQKLIWINTWNCWAETTTIEPTANLGSKYPAGNYQFDMLEVVREIFGDETFYTSPLPFTNIIELQIGNSTFTVNGISKTLDSPPVIKNSRTLLPIRAIIESLGGVVSWDATERKVTVSLGSKTIELWIGKSTAKVNGADIPIDAANPKVVPEIINSRTMLPLRFITENLGCEVQWDGTTQTITITYSS